MEHLTGIYALGLGGSPLFPRRERSDFIHCPIILPTIRRVGHAHPPLLALKANLQRGHTLGDPFHVNLGAVGSAVDVEPYRVPGRARQCIRRDQKKQGPAPDLQQGRSCLCATICHSAAERKPRSLQWRGLHGAHGCGRHIFLLLQSAPASSQSASTKLQTVDSAWTGNSGDSWITSY
jgi:hypothetical protein